MDRLKHYCATRSGFILVDVAGVCQKTTIQAATVAGTRREAVRRRTFRQGNHRASPIKLESHEGDGGKARP
jgi:hypothetical protein